MLAGRARSCRRGFTLRDLCVLIACAVVAAAFLLPALSDQQHGYSQIKCAANLKNIGLAMQIYANNYGGVFPRTYYDPAQPKPTEYTGIRALNSFAADGPAPNDVTAAIFHLMRTERTLAAIVRL